MASAYPALEQALSETAQTAARLSPDAAYYWACHAPRYRHVGRLLTQLAAAKPVTRVLDVGMGFEVGVLSRLLPSARIDCLGTYEDDRFRPPRDYQFYPADLNDLAASVRPAHVEPYDILVCMEVLEHLYTPPELVLTVLATWVKERGIVVLTTPNAAWLKNRIKLLRGKNPFERLRPDKRDMGHIREYTRPELLQAITASGLECVHSDVRGLYHFNNPKDNAYSRLADWTLPSLRRTLVAVCEKPEAQLRSNGGFSA